MPIAPRLIFTAIALVCLATPATAQDSARPYRPGDGIVAPRVTKESKPNYTKEAREARIQGVVKLDAVVLEDGTVGEVRITQSLDDKYGLDAEAVRTLKQWVFEPGTKDGKAVPVRVDVEFSFTLK